jgi:Protein of unknown function (DUF2637)
MPDPGFARPDLCPVRAAAGQPEPAGAVRGGLSADSHPPRGIDRAIRLSTAAAVLAVAGIAAHVSYGHAYAGIRAHGETGITARLGPAAIDGLVYASSMVVLYAARHRVPVPAWPAGCSRWASPRPSRRTWPRAGRTVWSGRWSRPGRRSVSRARTNFWSGSSAPAGRQTAGRQQSTPATVRPAVLRPVPSRPQPPTASAPEGASATRQTWRGGPRVRPPGCRLRPPAGGVTMRRLRPALAMTRRCPRTGSACRPATRCRNAGSPRCSGAHPAAGREPESPMHDRHRRSQTRRHPHNRPAGNQHDAVADIVAESCCTRLGLGCRHAAHHDPAPRSRRARNPGALNGSRSVRALPCGTP